MHFLPRETWTKLRNKNIKIFKSKCPILSYFSMKAQNPRPISKTHQLTTNQTHKNRFFPSTNLQKTSQTPHFTARKHRKTHSFFSQKKHQKTIPQDPSSHQKAPPCRVFGTAWSSLLGPGAQLSCVDSAAGGGTAGSSGDHRRKRGLERGGGDGNKISSGF